MGIWDSVKKVGTEHRERKEKYEEMSTDELFNIIGSDGFFSNTMTEKSCAMAVLKNRGISQDEINYHFKR